MARIVCLPRALRAASILTVVILAGAGTPVAAQSAGCHPALPVIRSEKGLIFTAEAFARETWRERSSDGRMLDHGRQIWRGRVGSRVAYLTFDEIPGTSGPNHAMDTRLTRLRGQPVWQSTGTRYDLGAWFVIREGALAGEWAVTNC